MLKNILKLEGAQELSKKEQNTINGGDVGCHDNCYYCVGNRCIQFWH